MLIQPRFRSGRDGGEWGIEWAVFDPAVPNTALQQFCEAEGWTAGGSGLLLGNEPDIRRSPTRTLVTWRWLFNI